MDHPTFSLFQQKKSVLATCALLSFFAGCSIANETQSWIPQHHDDPVESRHLKDLEAALPERAAVQPAKDRRVLVFSATQKFRHKSVSLGKIALQRLGEKTGAYTAVVSDDPANFEAAALRQFDAVILLSPTGDFFMPNPNTKDTFSPADWQQLEKRHERLVNNLIAYVEAGGGLMGIHSATDACYGHNHYGEMIGGYFAGHPWNWKSNVTIIVEEPEHPSIKPVFKDRTILSWLRKFTYTVRNRTLAQIIASCLVSTQSAVNRSKK